MNIFKFKLKQTFPVFVSCLMLCACSNSAAPKPQTKEMFAFDTYVSITSYDSSVDGTQELLNALSEEFSETYNQKASEFAGENYPNTRKCTSPHQHRIAKLIRVLPNPFKFRA